MAIQQPELWGGLECTINRVQDRFLDQFELGNLYAQPNSEALAGLGVRKLRFPVLWERHQPVPGGAIDWSWTEQQLNFYREQGIDPIATLVHHGSGPSHTNLLDPNFPQLLAAYARQVALQFPWLDYYTPVNEPLTTARFSGLYGLWYPHKKDNKSFLRCLLHQLKGVVLSMAEIRAVNPNAKLVQTEDLGKTFSSPKLAYQAKFENERRWLTYDILCGRLDEGHRLWKFFLRNGVSESELQFFREHPCPPDVFGFNYYVTSERYLDDNIQNYPGLEAGGNGRHRYVDVEAARVRLAEKTGIGVLLTEAWMRFRRPMAITEVHLNCHREDQLRWFKNVWAEATVLAKSGMDLRAVTAWALMGSYGWNKLLTCEDCDYEPGAFDLRGGIARPTALAAYLKSLHGSSTDDHLWEGEGWWQRDDRFFDAAKTTRLEIRHHSRRPPILIIGRTGTLGQAFGKVCADRQLVYKLATRQQCDISSADSIRDALAGFKPWAVINAAGYVRVDDAESDRDACLLANHLGPVQLAQACHELGLPLVSFSSDLVFDGVKQDPYVETDATHPLNIYGESKAQAEQGIIAAHPAALIVRTSAFFGPWDHYNFFHWIEQNLAEGKEVTVASDLWVSPTYVPDLVHTTLDLLVDRERGIWHLANRGSFTWEQLALLVAEQRGLDPGLIRAVPAAEMGYAARRPKNSVLASARGGLMPDASNAFHRYFAAKTGLSGATVQTKNSDGINAPRSPRRA